MSPDISDISLERAIELWTRRHSGAWTKDDDNSLKAWLDAAPQHLAAYRRVERAWHAAEQLRDRIQRTHVPRRSVPLVPLAAACGVLLLVVIAVPLERAAEHWWSGTPVDWTTPVGATRALVLSDGTKVLLDADSELVTQLGAGTRRVLLKRGEALFSVTHENLRPFEVHTAAGQIRDLGTRFDVEILAGSTHVSVLQGRVQVSTPHGELLLHAEQAGGYDGDGAFLAVRKVGDFTPGDRREFKAEPLSDVLERLTRYHDVTFVYSEPSLKNRRVSGTFHLSNLPLFLRTLSLALQVQTRSVDPHRIEISIPPSDPGLRQK
jgi:transmembrane sensor